MTAAKRKTIRTIRARWLRTGRCYVCGQPRGMTVRRASWGRPRGPRRTRRRSAKYCAYHLWTNRRYAARHRQRARRAA